MVRISLPAYDAEQPLDCMSPAEPRLSIRVAAIAYRQCVKGRSPDLPGVGQLGLEPRYLAAESNHLDLGIACSPLHALQCSGAFLRFPGPTLYGLFRFGRPPLRDHQGAGVLRRRFGGTPSGFECSDDLAAHGRLPDAPLLGLSLELRHGLLQSGELIANALQLLLAQSSELIANALQFLLAQ